MIEYIKERMYRASTRKGIYRDYSETYGKTEACYRMRAWRQNLTSRAHCLNCAFSEEEEDALVYVCQAYARQNEPFTIPEFIEIASIFAGRVEESQYFTRSFVRGFLKRHPEALLKRKGKPTSPTRCSDTMLQKTQEFIDMLNSDMERHIINSCNIVVFDETIIGDSLSLPVVIGERRRSGGKTINVKYTRQSALGCYIPFSMPDGSTPFRVFIFKTGNLKKNETIVTVHVPPGEKGLRGDPYRLYLGNETGFLNLETFQVNHGEVFFLVEHYSAWS